MDEAFCKRQAEEEGLDLEGEEAITYWTQLGRDYITAAMNHLVDTRREWKARKDISTVEWEKQKPSEKIGKEYNAPTLYSDEEKEEQKKKVEDDSESISSIGEDDDDDDDDDMSDVANEEVNTQPLPSSATATKPPKEQANRKHPHQSS